MGDEQGAQGQGDEGQGALFGERGQADDAPGDEDLDQPTPAGTRPAHQFNEQQHAERGEHDGQVIVVDRAADEQEHGHEGVDGGRPQGDFRPAGGDVAGDGVGEGDGDRAHEHRGQAHQAHGQPRPLPGVPGRVVHGQVDVAIGGDDAVVNVGVEPAHLVHVAGVYPEGEGGGEVVVERWLAGLLFPGAGQGGVEGLHGQGVAVGQVADHGVVPQLVGGLEDGGDQGVAAAQEDEEGEDQAQEAFFAHGG